MDNQTIVAYLLEMARALEYLEENPFRAQAYSRAARSIQALGVNVSELAARGAISGIPGIGKGIASTIEAWVIRGDFSELERLRAMLPLGIDELLKVPGLGLKRIRVLSRELKVETLEDLLEALEQGRLSGLRAFPRRFVEQLPALVKRVMSYRGKYLLDRSLARAGAVLKRLTAGGIEARLTGECRRCLEIVELVEILVGLPPGGGEEVLKVLGEPGGVLRDESVTVPGSAEWPPVMLHLVSPGSRAVRLLVTTGSREHLEALRRHAAGLGVEIGDDFLIRQGEPVEVSEEEDIYRIAGLQYLPPEVREGRPSEIERARAHAVPDLISLEDIRGAIHIHTDRSDGVSPLKDMVLAARSRGCEWIGISDHSRSAGYAGGLDVESLAQQHGEIDALERELGDIRIFKGIESDILPDGSLDYPPEVLEGFDFVIASVHSHMDMDRRTMTKRIIKALRNPFTTVLGHPTGRLLLSREPYEVDMEAILEEALASQVAVEINASPYRLDLDWRLIDEFVSRGGIIAISPDAHSVEGLSDMTYGVMIARKGFVTAGSCLNTYSARQAREWFGKP
ncbi:MAG: PHP domain-containing protein [Desulfomonilia bacterium]